MPRMRAPDGSELDIESPEGVASMKALGWTVTSGQSKSERSDYSNDDDETERPRRRPGRPRKQG